MNHSLFSARRTFQMGLAAAGLALLAGAQAAVPVWLQMEKPMPGGRVPHSKITNITAGQQVTVNWAGFGGPYVVERSQNLVSWEALQTVNDPTVSIPNQGAHSFLRVKSTGDPGYVGADTCKLCHRNTHTTWGGTGHATALSTLKAINQHTNSVCLVCHTVGFGFASGFKDEATTPGLAGVQCESCHGPGQAHVNDPIDLTKRPATDLTAQVCGGCHTGFHHPTYEEWGSTLHASVNPNLIGSPTSSSGFLSTNGVARMNACGACHSGSVRMTMVKGEALPSGAEASEIGITCAVCHAPHGSTFDAQLRNPTHSTNFFSYRTSTNFASQYLPEVSICGQCHNMRGASATDTSRYPHYSPQYNIHIGQGGIASSAVASAAHQEIACATCHVHRTEPAKPTYENPVYTGHQFEVHMPSSCAPCHSATIAPALKQAVQTEIHDKMIEVKALLDAWATNKAPEAIRTKYGPLAWEYNTPGHFSNPNGLSTIRGPSTTEQTNIPTVIKEARFNLYLVDQDGSHGIHNGPYVRNLLETAKQKVLAAP